MIALLSFREGTGPAAYLPSPELAADMAGFDVGDIVGVEELLLDPVAGSPPA